jgi:hypothetical protein
MALDLTAFDPVLKHHYYKGRIYSMADLKNVFLGLVKKDPKAGGKQLICPVDFEDPQGGSATFSDAQTNTGASKYEDFVGTRKKNYQVAVIDNETIEASKRDADAFLPAFREVDKAFKRAGRRLGIQLYRSGGGAIGVLSSDTTPASGKVVDLEDNADAFNFQVGMTNVFAAANGTGSLRDSGATNVVASINREAGTVTYTDDLDANVTAIAVGDFIFSEGDFGNCLNGLADWVPSSAPGATPFFGVDRTQDIDRLGGLRRTASGESLYESLIKGVATLEKHGADPTHVLANQETVSDLILEATGKVIYERCESKGERAKIGFKGFSIMVGNSEVTIHADINCPSNRMYILQLNTWCLQSAGPTPMFLQRDNLLIRSALADSYEVRVGGYQNLTCSAPGYNMVVILG